MNAIIPDSFYSSYHTLINWCQYCYSLVGLPNLSSDEMSAKTSRILVLVSVIWTNFHHSLVSLTKISDF